MLKKFNLSTFQLHIIAMLLMLCDHVWAALLPEQEWLTCLGRAAFPIFAFLIAEGVRQTKNLKAYMLRLLILACLSEIPFDLLYSGIPIYPYHQNVIWTLLIGLVAMAILESARQNDPKLNHGLWMTGGLAVTAIAVLAAQVTMTDYYGYGILTIMLFYATRKQTWPSRIKLIGMYVINVEMLGGLCYQIHLASQTIEIQQQAFALLALIPIWLYQGRQGLHNEAVKTVFYGFYPAHMLVLAAIQAILLK